MNNEGKVALCPLIVQEERCKAMLVTKLKNANNSSTAISRLNLNNSNGRGNIHVARGPHEGLLVYKNISLKDSEISEPPDVTLQFKVFLGLSNIPNKNSPTSFIQERRVLKFWFDPCVCDDIEQWREANAFFTKLLSPQQFPRDYVGFIKKVMKLVQINSKINMVELRLTTIPSDPEYLPKTVNTLEETEEEYYVHISSKILEWIECAYPNTLSTEYITECLQKEPDYCPGKINNFDEKMMPTLLQKLKETGKISQMPDGSWIRVVKGRNVKRSKNANSKFRQNESDKDCVTRNILDFNSDLVNNRNSNSCSMSSKTESRPGSWSSSNIDINNEINTFDFSARPTIAIVTSKFCEKMAVDATLRDASTFIKYKSQGDSHVYTLGYIGLHRVVSTKLPLLGSSIQALTCAGNSITRLLGTFQSIKYVFLVGVGMGVDHFIEYKKQFRLGDVIVSTRTPDCDYVYVRCDEMTPYCHPSEIRCSTADANINFKNETSQLVTNDPEQYIASNFNIQTWRPKSLELEHIINDLVCQYIKNPKQCPWLSPLQEAYQILKSGADIDFGRPTALNDKIPIWVGEGDLIQLDHDASQKTHLVQGMPPNVHLGAVGSLNFGGHLELGNLERVLRSSLSHKYGILAFDSEACSTSATESILESVRGNCVDSYIVIRGISEQPGGRSCDDKSWQPYASLTAASVAKAIISNLPS